MTPMTSLFSGPRALLPFVSAARGAALVLLFCLSSAASAVDVIDIRFIVDSAAAPDEAAREALRGRLIRQVDTLNEYYRNSAVELEARMVEIAFTPIAEREALRLLDAMKSETGPFVGLFRRAARIGADYTFVLVRGLTVRGQGRCGRALDINRSREALASTRKALAVMDSACGAQTLAHELGHLMGLNHGSLVDRCQPDRGHTSALAPHANGFGVGNCDGRPQPGEFGTIMVGGWMRAVVGDQHASLPMYSNPLVHHVDCGARGRCGDLERGDAARFLNEHAALYAGHETANAVPLSPHDQ